MTQRKKLIEVALPLEAINQASAREKSIRHGHPSTLHLWWARRPLAAARAVIFASLVDDPDSPDAPPEFVAACKRLPAKANALVNDTPRMHLFDFIEDLVQWENTTNETILNQARELIRLATNGEPPPLLDPFAGGGSIPLEAQRLGLEAHASDLNPVAVMINKAQIEIPPRFADLPPVNPRDRAKMGGHDNWKGTAGLAADVRYYGEWMRERAWERIGHLYPKYNGETVIAWYWTRTAKCPNPACGGEMPLASSFDLSKKKAIRAWIEPIVDKDAKTVSFHVQSGSGKPTAPPKLGRGARFRCIFCDEVALEQHLKTEGGAKRLGTRLMAVITEGIGRRNYRNPVEAHESIVLDTLPNWQPSGQIANDRRWFSPPIYGFPDFADLFTPRQLIAMTTLSELIAEAKKQVIADAVNVGRSNDTANLRDGGRGAFAYAEAIAVYLSFVVDRFAPYCNSFSTWHSSADFVRATFARQAIGMAWDFVEVNPFSSSTGNFGDNIEWVAEATESIKFLNTNNEHIIVSQEDASSLSNLEFSPLISTDPPYYDNIGYADLSDFFYVWLRRNLREIYPDIFSTMLVPKSTELTAIPYHFGGDRDAAM